MTLAAPEREAGACIDAAIVAYERKALVFGVAAAMLLISGLALSEARKLPCPADPALAAGCERLRRASARLFAGSVIVVAVGAFAAFVLPALSG